MEKFFATKSCVLLRGPGGSTTGSVRLRVPPRRSHQSTPADALLLLLGSCGIGADDGHWKKSGVPATHSQLTSCSNAIETAAVFTAFSRFSAPNDSEIVSGSDIPGDTEYSDKNIAQTVTMPLSAFSPHNGQTDVQL